MTDREFKTLMTRLTAIASVLLAIYVVGVYLCTRSGL
jgi:succinate dehydrogenase hydrophobic anchor subunit